MEGNMLTDTAIRKTKSTDKTQKLFDGGGLYLEIATSGGKLWRFKYRFNGKEKLLALGKYPDVPLQTARRRHMEARSLLAQGVDPAATKQAQKAAGKERAANTFEVIAREWFEGHKKTLSVGYAKSVLSRMERLIFPYIGTRPVAELKAPEILGVCRRVSDRGLVDTAHDVQQYISQAMRYAVLTGRSEHDPCSALRGALPPVHVKHYPSIIEPVKVAELLQAIDAYSGSLVVRAALRLAPLVFVRPGELREARWADIDIDRAEWIFIYKKQRMRNPEKAQTIVPLSRQALEILGDIRLMTGGGEYVFPGVRSGRPMSNMTINRALQSMGYDTRTEITGHGFRAMARTLLAERLHKPSEWIERQLSHRTKESLGEAYDRTQFIDDRRKMMQVWADYLDKLKTGVIAGVVPFPANG